MTNVLIAVVLGAVALGGAWIINRKKPRTSAVVDHHVPTHVDRADFARPEAPVLVAVFTSATCATCAVMLSTARARRERRGRRRRSRSYGSGRRARPVPDRRGADRGRRRSRRCGPGVFRGIDECRRPRRRDRSGVDPVAVQAGSVSRTRRLSVRPRMGPASRRAPLRGPAARGASPRRRRSSRARAAPGRRGRGRCGAR